MTVHGRRSRVGAWRGVVVPLAVVITAQLAATATNLQSDSLAAPVDIVVAWLGALADGTLIERTLQTLATAGAGLLIGTAFGLTTGILLALCPPANFLLELMIEIVRPVPSVALIPLAMLIFGFGYRMEIATVAFATAWPVLILARAAVAGIEPGLLEVSRVLVLGVFARTVKIIIPAALPRLFVAFRLATGVALIVAVTVEIAANPLGLGYEMMSAEQSLRPALMFALLVWIGCVGWILNALLLWTEARLFGGAAVPDRPA